MFDFIIDNIYIFLVIAGVIASWLKNQSEAKEQRELDEQSEKTLRDIIASEEKRAPRQRPAQKIRKRVTVPPPVPANQGAATSKPPALPDFTEQAAKQEDMMEKVREFKRAKKQKANMTSAPAHNYDAPSKQAHTSALTQLKSRSGLKEAFILKEVLDKPVGIR